MAPKKKNRGNKLARMTEEEKLRYLQHKAAMEEEAQRRKQELVATFLKTKMLHEESFARLNSAKINEQWRRILRQIKCKELKEDMETMRQRFEVSLECKNKVIENLLNDFEDAEFQYSLQYQTQMEVILKLLDIHQSRFSDLQNWYNTQVRDIIQSDVAERKKLKEEFQHQFNKLQITYNDSRQKSEQRTKDLRSKFIANKNELQTKLLYTMVKMEETYTDEIHKMKTRYNQVLQTHREATDTKQAHYTILAAKDDADTARISENFHQITSLTDAIKHLKHKHKTLATTYSEQITQLIQEKETIRKEQRKYRHNHETLLARDSQQLQILTEISNNHIKNLKQKFKKLAALMQIADTCRTLHCHHAHSTDQKSAPFHPLMDELENVAENTLSYSTFNTFWNHYSDVKIDNDLLKIKKNELISQNNDLKKSLQKYMLSVRRSSSVPRKCGI